MKKIAKILLPLALCFVLLAGCGKKVELANPEDYRDHPYQEKAVFEKGSDSYQKITGMIRSLMEAQLDKNEQIEGLGRRLDQTLGVLDLSQGTYLTYEYAADSYAPVYFSIPDNPDDVLISVGSADYRDDAGPHAFIHSQELLDYLNKQ